MQAALYVPLSNKHNLIFYEVLIDLLFLFRK